MDGLLSGRIVFPRTHFFDSDELSTVYRSWGMDIVQLNAETGDRWTASGELGDLRVWASSLTGRYRVRSGLPAGSVLVQISPDSQGSRRVGGLDLQADDVLAGFAGLQLTGVLDQQRRGTSFILPVDTVTAALAARAPGADRLTRRTAPLILPKSGPRIEALSRLIDAALCLENERDRLFASDEIVDLLLGTLLSPWHRNADTVFRAPTFQRLPIVQRVEAFMRDRLGDRLTLHDICHAARASQRSVEYAFSTTYGMGPKQYLKVLRLNAVWQALKSQPPELERIGEIARRYGFWHMGHFTTDYYRVFGETAQQTRARRWRR